jgi:signal transduction histidine kinase
LQKSADQIKDEIEMLLADAKIAADDNLSQAIDLTEKALFKSQKIKDKDSIHARALNQLASIQRRNQEFSTAKGLANRAIELSGKIKFKEGVAHGKYNLAKILLNENKPSEALPYLLNATDTFKALALHHLHAKCLCLLGRIYEQFTDFKGAVESYQKALDVIKQVDNRRVKSNVYLYLANVHLSINKLTKANHYIDKALSIKKDNDLKDGLAQAYYLKGKIHLKLKEAENALSSLDMARELFHFNNDKEGVAETKLEIAEVYMAIHEFEEAERYLHIALKICEQHKFSKPLYKCHHLLSKVYKISDQAKALEHLEKYVAEKEKYDDLYIKNMVDSFEMISQIEDHEKDVEIEQAKASIIERKNSEMDSFFYRVSHDLKGPIASLLGLSELAKKDIKDADALHYLGMYENQIKRLNMIVMELINITELNYRDVQLSKINFYEIIDNCITAYTYLPHFDKIKFRIDVGSDLKFNSEWYIVNTILQNLIENSIKYIDIEKNQQIVDISVKRDRNNIIIKLADNGLGIPAEHQERIFEMFFRASNNAEGTGLGLFILKRAVERLKGDVSLTSELSKGTTFIISLPLQ